MSESKYPKHYLENLRKAPDDIQWKCPVCAQWTDSYTLRIEISGGFVLCGIAFPAGVYDIARINMEPIERTEIVE